MNAAPNCDRCDELLVDYAYGELPESAERDVASHLSTCARCRGAYAAMASTRRAMQHLAPVDAPAAGLESLLEAAGRAAAQRARPPRSAIFARWLAPAFGSGMAIALVIAVSAVLWPRGSRAPTSDGEGLAAPAAPPGAGADFGGKKSLPASDTASGTSTSEPTPAAVGPVDETAEASATPQVPNDPGPSRAPAWGFAGARREADEAPAARSAADLAKRRSPADELAATEIAQRQEPAAGAASAAAPRGAGASAVGHPFTRAKREMKRALVPSASPAAGPALEPPASPPEPSAAELFEKYSRRAEEKADRTDVASASPGAKDFGPSRAPAKGKSEASARTDAPVGDDVRSTQLTPPPATPASRQGAIEFDRNKAPAQRKSGATEQGDAPPTEDARRAQRAPAPPSPPGPIPVGPSEAPSAATVAVSRGRAVEVPGACETTVISKAINRHANEIRYCYEVELTEDPNLYGKVAVSFTIDPTGAVSEASVQQTTLNNNNVEQCMLSRIRRWKFPEPKGGGQCVINYPWVLSPAAGLAGRAEALAGTRPAEAARLYVRAADEESHDARAAAWLFEAARLYFAAGEHALVIAVCERIRREHGATPYAPKAAIQKSAAYAAQQRLDDEQDALEDLVLRHPTSAEAVAARQRLVEVKRLRGAAPPAKPATIDYGSKAGH